MPKLVDWILWSFKYKIKESLCFRLQNTCSIYVYIFNYYARLYRKSVIFFLSPRSSRKMNSLLVSQRRTCCGSCFCRRERNSILSNLRSQNSVASPQRDFCRRYRKESLERKSIYTGCKRFEIISLIFQWKNTVSYLTPNCNGETKKGNLSV